MDKDLFVQKVKYLCLQKGVKPTNACRESGVGGSFLNDIQRGRLPSIDKFEKIAHYLGTTVSDLIGELPPQASAIPDQPYLVMRYNQLSQEGQEKVMAFVEFTALQEKQAKKEDE